MLFTPAAVAGAGDGAAATARKSPRENPILARQVEDEVGSGRNPRAPGTLGDARHQTVPPRRLLDLKSVLEQNYTLQGLQSFFEERMQ